MKFLQPIFQILSLFLITQVVSAQSISTEVLANSGDNFTAGNVSLNWTLGENVTDVLTANPYITTLGFHQTFSVSPKSGILSESSVKVYPNPAKDFVHISMKKISGKVTLELYDLAGKKLHKEKIDAVEDYSFNLKKYADGKYLLKVTSNKTNTFAILKSSK